MSRNQLPNAQAFIPDVDHPVLNAMRNCLRGDKATIPVQLLKDGKEVYAAEVKMIGHTHSLYRAALDATLAGIATRVPAIEWDHVRFHNPAPVAKEPYIQPEASLSAYITIYRKIDSRLALIDAVENMHKVIKEPVNAQTKMELEHSFLRLCAAIIAPSVEVTPAPAYAPRKGLLRRFIPKF